MIEEASMGSGRWAIVTGASQGIGRAMAAEAARRGYDLMLLALPGTGLEGISDDLSRLYEVDSEFWEIDLANRDAVDDFAMAVRTGGYAVSLLINNAGVGGTMTFAEQPASRIQSIIDVNVGALTQLTRLLLPVLIGEGDAHILNVASLAGWYPSPGMGVYAATKAYVISLSLALREELKGTGVTVSVLSPSGVVTKEEVVKALYDQGFWGRVTSRYPDQLARYAIRRTLWGRPILVPGLVNRTLRIAGRIVPLRWLTRVVGGRFASTQQRRPRKVTAAVPEPVRM